MKQTGSRVVIPREVLLVEIERRCRDSVCNARTRIGLTKSEARAYCGFECERCEQFWDDLLTERDVPEWWEELAITDLYAVRENRGDEPEETSEVVKRMSENFRRATGHAGSSESGEEDSF
jgi:hypothetical protein